MDEQQMNKSCRFALAAVLHNLSRFSGRAGITLEDAIQAVSAHAPEKIDITELAGKSIVAGDSLASGFTEAEATRHISDEPEARSLGGKGEPWQNERLLSLFEQVRLDSKENQNYAYSLPLSPLSPESIFPKRRSECLPKNKTDAINAYRNLWDGFIKALGKIPAAHKRSWPLWLDHFDSAWLTYTHAIPTDADGNRPEVSLYDHSRTTAALAVALDRWHSSDKKVDENPFLLIQGDFFGIQDFIFAEGRETNRQAAKLLRGRSLHVSILMETAAIKILDVLNLPSTSQIINAAGKCLIIAENTSETIDKLKSVQQEMNQWFIKHTYGIAGIGIAWQSASTSDFIGNDSSRTGFASLMKRLFEQLETAKLQRFNLCSQASPVLPMESFDEPCAWHGHLPADGKTEDKPSSAITRDQLKMGRRLVRSSRILLLKETAIIQEGGNTVSCELPVFGYRIAFTQEEEITGRFAKFAQDGTLRRCWDFSLPDRTDTVLWNGYARRNINGYVPYFEDQDLITKDKYTDVEEAVTIGQIKTFNHIACEDRQIDKDGKLKGLVALMTLKGDVDNLGRIFREGLPGYSLAKMTALSRQMNAFFAIWLPTACASSYRNTYTVFAGGDDFFLIGPWYSTQKLATEMYASFRRYTAENPEIHFSIGMVITKPGYPVYALAESAEDALSAAKEVKDKNAVKLFNKPVKWATWQELKQAEETLEDLKETYGLSTGYLYSLFALADLAESEKTEQKIEAAMWRSQLAYRTIRTVPMKDKQAKQVALKRIVTEIGEKGISAYRAAYRIPLSNYFYRQR